MTLIAEGTVPVAPALRRHSRLEPWVFPGIVTVLFAALVGFGVNGSSFDVLGTQQSQQGIFRPQFIRADEWLNNTPAAIMFSRQGFPNEGYVGLTKTDLSVVPNVPTSDWEQLLRPSTWGYHFFGPLRGLAWQWWFSIALALVGTYWLLLRLTGSLPVSIGLSLVGVFAPTNAWWSNWPALTMGFLCVAAAAILTAFRTTRTVNRVVLAVCAGLAGAAAFLALYPPWLISGALVVAALIAGVALDERPGWRRFLQSVVPAAFVSGGAVLAFLITNRPAVGAMTETIYPGGRVSSSGEGHLSLLSDAVSSPVIGYGREVGLLNQSEVSSPWFVGPTLLVALVFLCWSAIKAGRRMPEGWGDREVAGTGLVTFLLMSASGVILFAWAYVPGVPVTLGRVTMLSSVPGYRVQVALGLWAVLVIALSFEAATRVKPGAAWLGAFGLSGVASATLMLLAALAVLAAPPGPRGLAVMAACAALMAGGLAALAAGRWSVVTSILVGTVALVTYAVVNPLNRDLGPLGSDPLANRVAVLARGEPYPTMVVFAPGATMPLVKAAGVQLLNGQTMYPDREFWEQVMPGREDVWNNYRNYAWEFADSGPPITAEVIGQDQAILTVNICSRELQALEVDWVLTAYGLQPKCAQKVDQFEWRGEDIQIFRMANEAG